MVDKAIDNEFKTYKDMKESKDIMIGKLGKLDDIFSINKKIKKILHDKHVDIRHNGGGRPYQNGGSINLYEKSEYLDDINADNNNELNDKDLSDINSDNTEDFDDENFNDEDFDSEDFDNEDSDNNEDNYSGGESDDSLKLFSGGGIITSLTGTTKFGTKSNHSHHLNSPIEMVDNKLKTAKTGQCFELGKKFNNTGSSNLEEKDVNKLYAFWVIATFEFYIKLEEKKSETSVEPAASDSDSVSDYEIDKFFRAYLERLIKFTKLNIYVIVNCSSILQELSKAIHILITKKLDDALKDVDKDDSTDTQVRNQKEERKLRKDRGEETLADLMDDKDIFGKSSYFNMHSLAMMNFIFDTYNSGIPKIEEIIKSTNNTNERLAQISKYLTLNYDMTILGKDTSKEVNERYVEENKYIDNLLKDLFPKMGFMDKSIMRNLKKYDTIIENYSDNTLLLQNELQELINITFENGNILFENEKVSEMKKQDNSDMLQQKIDNLQNDIQKLQGLQGLQGVKGE